MAITERLDPLHFHDFFFQNILICFARRRFALATSARKNMLASSVNVFDHVVRVPLVLFLLIDQLCKGEQEHNILLSKFFFEQVDTFAEWLVACHKEEKQL